MIMAEMDKNNLKISVIMPVYNVEKYLQQCLDSIVLQTYQNLARDGDTFIVG
jgi:glycosyltransferase involved in cell wall biosynthesis